MFVCKFVNADADVHAYLYMMVRLWMLWAQVALGQAGGSLFSVGVNADGAKTVLQKNDSQKMTPKSSESKKRTRTDSGKKFGKKKTDSGKKSKPRFGKNVPPRFGKKKGPGRFGKKSPDSGKFDEIREKRNDSGKNKMRGKYENSHASLVLRSP